MDNIFFLPTSCNKWNNEFVNASEAWNCVGLDISTLHPTYSAFTLFLHLCRFHIKNKHKMKWSDVIRCFFVYVFIQKCVYISTPFIKHVHSTFKNIKSELTFYPFVPSTVCLNAAEKWLCALIRRLQNCPFCLSFCFRFKHTTVPLTSTFTSMLHAGGKHTLCGHLHEKKKEAA